MSEADKIVNDTLYINNIFNHIKSNWPVLFAAIDHTRHSYSKRIKLKEIIGYDGDNTFDGIIKHIQENEHMLEWWLL